MSFPAKCECKEAGFCEAMKRKVSSGIQRECATNHRFRLKMAEVPSDQWTEAERPKRKSKPKRPDCIHLGPPVNYLNGNGCGCKQKIRECDLHGICTTGEYRTPLLHCCKDCPDREND